mgnify:CR=1 FL=1
MANLLLNDSSKNELIISGMPSNEIGTDKQEKFEKVIGAGRAYVAMRIVDRRN